MYKYADCKGLAPLKTYKNQEIKWYMKSKSVCDSKEKNDLLFCNMDTWGDRKVNHEKVQVDTTLRDRNLWISQGRMCWKEIYNTLL